MLMYLVKTRLIATMLCSTVINIFIDITELGQLPPIVKYITSDKKIKNSSV